MSKNFIKSDQVIGDTVNNESIILNFETGIYYSCNNSGSAIWEYLEKGCTVDDLLTLFTPDEKIKESIVSFIEGLISENLITTSQNSYPFVIPSEKNDFVPPQIEKYTDMKDLLELDPIHEIYHIPNKKNT